MELGQLIQATLTDAQQQIRANISSTGENASGKTSNSILVRASGGKYQLYSDGSGAPLETLEVGRKAGKVPYNFTEILEDWARAKGLNIDPWAVLWKIKREGTVRHRDPSQRKDIYSTIVTQTAEKLKGTIKKALFQEVKIAINRHF